MSELGLRTTTPAAEYNSRPEDSELDLFGLTHVGKLRSENQDQFLLATVHPRVVVHGSSLPVDVDLPLNGPRVATVMMVADGVGGGVNGAEASSLAVRTATQYVTHALRCYHDSGSKAETLENELAAAAYAAHDAVRAERLSREELRTMATTLTIALAIWPTAYILQVGDSRCYIYQEGHFRRLTRDQTVAQVLLDQGVFTKESAAVSPLGNVLASAIGADEATPEVTRVDITARSLFLLCSDGLTKHVKDAEIEEAIRTMTSSEQLARALLLLALERGGSDNVTILVARAKGVR